MPPAHHKMCLSSRDLPLVNPHNGGLFDDSGKRSMCIGTYLCSLRSTLLKYLKVAMVIISERKLCERSLRETAADDDDRWGSHAKSGQTEVLKRRTDENVL